MMSVLLALGLLSACSKSDDVTDINNHSEKDGTGTIEKSSDLMVDFRLQNEDGMECYDFKEGDNIIFRLEIKNDTDENAILPPFSEVLGLDVFSVYSQEGEEIGTPWDVIMTSFRECEIMPYLSVPGLTSRPCIIMELSITIPSISIKRMINRRFPKGNTILNLISSLMKRR